MALGGCAGGMFGVNIAPACIAPELGTCGWLGAIALGGCAGAIALGGCAGAIALGG
jgi:hypothetical protein